MPTDSRQPPPEGDGHREQVRTEPEYDRNGNRNITRRRQENMKNKESRQVDALAYMRRIAAERLTTDVQSEARMYMMVAIALYTGSEVDRVAANCACHKAEYREGTALGFGENKDEATA